MEITRISHVNVNCSDLARSKAFYEAFLDLTTSAHTNPAPQPLAGFGIASGQWDAYILRDRTPGLPVRVDLLEWKQPGPVGRPYPAFNHLGFFRLCFLARDLDQKYAELVARGVECLSPPQVYRLGTAPDRSVRMFCFKDPDGTVLELVEGDTDRLAHVNINCSDLNRSRAFYEGVLGLEATARSTPLPQPGAGFGAGGEVAWDAVFLTHKDADYRFVIDLLEWKQPRPTGRPYTAANNLGIFRLAFSVRDIEGAYAELQAKGVACAGPPEVLHMGEGLPDLKVLLFTDPDGTTLEFIERA